MCDVMVNHKCDQISVKFVLGLSRRKKIVDKLETVGKVSMHFYVVMYVV